MTCCQKLNTFDRTLSFDVDFRIPIQKLRQKALCEPSVYSPNYELYTPDFSATAQNGPRKILVALAAA